MYKQYLVGVLHCTTSQRKYCNFYASFKNNVIINQLLKVSIP